MRHISCAVILIMLPSRLYKNQNYFQGRMNANHFEFTLIFFLMCLSLAQKSFIFHCNKKKTYSAQYVNAARISEEKAQRQGFVFEHWCEA